MSSPSYSLKVCDILRMCALMGTDFANVSALSDSIETTMARLLARRIIIQHLQISTRNKFELEIFESFGSTRFREYLAANLVLHLEILNNLALSYPNA